MFWAALGQWVKMSDWTFHLFLNKGTELRKSAERMGAGQEQNRGPILKPEAGRVGGG